MTTGRRPASRWAAGLAAGWAGGLLCIAALAAPAAFAVLPKLDAGRVVGRLFAQEANVSLALSLLLFFVAKFVVVGTLAWRLTGAPRTPPSGDAFTAAGPTS